MVPALQACLLPAGAGLWLALSGAAEARPGRDRGEGAGCRRCNDDRDLRRGRGDEDSGRRDGRHGDDDRDDRRGGRDDDRGHRHGRSENRGAH